VIDPDPEFAGLLDRDYQSARDLMNNANGSIDRTRTFGFTLIAALIGFTAANHTLWLGALATLAALLIAYLDSTECAKYQEATKHAVRIERMQQLLYRERVGTANDADVTNLSRRKVAFRPGVLSGQGRLLTGSQRFSLGNLRNTLPVPIQCLYVLLAFAGLGVGIYESTVSSTTNVNARVLSAPEIRKAPATNLTVVVRDTMTRSEQGQLAGELRHSSRPAAHTLSNTITAVLSGTPGAAAMVFSALAKQGGGMEQQAGEILSKALTDAAVAAADSGDGTETTVNNNQSRFSLNAPSFVLNETPSGANTKKKSGGSSGSSGQGNRGPAGPPTLEQPTKTSTEPHPYTR
jgi:hypothetical protein